jgi:hypothetical protein
MQNIRLQSGLGFNGLASTQRLPMASRAAIIACLSIYMINVYTTMILYCAHKHNSTALETDAECDAFHAIMESDSTLLSSATAYQTIRGVGGNVLRLIVCSLRALANRIPIAPLARASDIPPEFVEHFLRLFTPAHDYLERVEAEFTASSTLQDEVTVYTRFVFAAIEAAMEEAAAQEDSDDDDITVIVNEDDKDDGAHADDEMEISSDVDDSPALPSAFEDVPEIIFNSETKRCDCSYCVSVRECVEIATQGENSVENFVEHLIRQAFDAELSAGEGGGPIRDDDSDDDDDVYDDDC